MLSFIDIHRRCQASETAVVDVRRAPVVVSGLFSCCLCAVGGCMRFRVVRLARCSGGKVMQQSRLSRHRSPDHMLQIPLPIPLNIHHRIPITSLCNKDSRLDDEVAQLLEGLSEAWQYGLGRPDIGRGVFWKRRVQFSSFGFEGLIG